MRVARRKPQARLFRDLKSEICPPQCFGGRFLDENLPESLLVTLQQLGHQADSVNSLRLKGARRGLALIS